MHIKRYNLRKFGIGLGVFCVVLLLPLKMTFAGFLDFDFDKIVRSIGDAFLSMVGLTTRAGGLFLEASFKYVVLGMGEMLQTGTGPGNMINDLWRVIRDFCNLAFIFGFIYLGVRTILDSESANTKKMLTSIIIGALLINFSLFFTKAIIDASNFLTVQIYSKTLGASTGDQWERGIAAIFMGPMKLTTTADKTGVGISNFEQVSSSPSIGAYLAYYFLASIVLIFAALVFTAAAALLIVRFVALIIIMIFSPLLFAATVFPKTDGIAKEMWSKLIGYSFFAPIFFFLLVVAYHASDAVSKQFDLLSNGKSGFNKAFAGGAEESFTVVIGFGVVMAFLMFSLTAAQKLSVAGASKAISMVKVGAGMAKVGAGMATAGLAAAGARSTFGRLGNRWANDDNLKDRAAHSWLARQQLRLGTASSKASFDARRVGGVGKNLGIGEGKKGGYAARVDAAKKKEDAFLKSLGTVDDTDERVLIRSNEVKEKEAALKEARRVLAGSAREDRPKAMANVQEAEEAIATARQQLEQERNRRALGSTFETTAGDTKAGEELVTEARKNQKAAITAYKEAKKDSTTSKEALEALRKKVKESVAEVKNAEAESKKVKQQKGAEKGYIDILDELGQKGFAPVAWATSTILGNNKSINRSIAAELRSQYTKKVKKTKEEKATDSIVDAVKSSKSE